MKEHPLQSFDYNISESNIGKQPAEPRDMAKLFVYDTQKDEIHLDRFYNLANYLPSKSLMVMNNTGVIPARAIFTKDTGGKVEGLFLYNEGIQDDGTIPVIVMKKLIPGRELTIADYRFKILRQHHQYFYLLPLFDIALLPEVMIQYGTTPTPHYLGQLDLKESQLRDRYQTIYADEKKSVAAPTASLHFTENVFEKLAEKKNRTNGGDSPCRNGNFCRCIRREYKAAPTAYRAFSYLSVDYIKTARSKKNKSKYHRSRHYGYSHPGVSGRLNLR